MDERQTQIKAGAGLEESRINQDLLNFLNKWSSPFLIVLSVAALVWAGLRYLDQRELERIDRAFGDLHDATIDGNPSPNSLLALATEYDGVRAVPELAKLTIIDLYLDAYLRGVHPGAEINPATGLPTDESQALDDQQRLSYLDQAGNLVNEILASTESDPSKSVLTINALSRAAAVAESRGEFDTARSYYKRIESIANDQALPGLALFAQRRAEHLDVLDPSLTLPSENDIAPIPGFQAPAAAAPEDLELPPEIQAQLDALREELTSDETSVDVTSPEDIPDEPGLDEPLPTSPDDQP